jgi:hypothetical protein
MLFCRYIWHIQPLDVYPSGSLDPLERRIQEALPSM